ncbi:MAG: RNA-binding transcriptional accessory protein [Actinobacteria bacterium]|nr:RNA-binding transcriptional accessory protein [Actinomycetota bacterium]
MEPKYSRQISLKLRIPATKVSAALKLLEDGSTIPFISRYRKEATGNLDETQILDIKKESEHLEEIDARRETILKELKKQGNLTEELEKMIEEAESLSVLEDIYLPFKPKRKTKATVAREMGLEPLAKLIFGQKDFDLNKEAGKYINENVKDAGSALEGAGFIIAEWINEGKRVRESVRCLFERDAIISLTVIKGMEEEGAKYRDYFDFSEPLNKIQSHRFLAIKRAENERILRVFIQPGEGDALEIMEKLLIISKNEASEFVRAAVKDCYKRLLCPSLETELTGIAKQKADEEAISVFSNNLRQLLLAPFLGRKRILAIDPGFRTGCKVVCLNEQGDLLFNDTIYPHPPVNKTKESEKKIKDMVSKYKIEAIAIGNGTASRETAQFINSIFNGSKAVKDNESIGEDKNTEGNKKNERIKNIEDVKVFVVSESGASVYSASAAAREEFPDYDVTVRGAVSIGRRLMDPLAELVKIDPKSIGVGQYQHDVDQSKLKKMLDFVVQSCVNLVGVNLNTASKHILMYVSGLGPKIAQNIIGYRKEKGAFLTREDLKNVPKLGAKAFEQCAGFLRITGGKNLLDGSAVHPESYYVVEKIARDLKLSVADLIGSDVKSKINPADYIDDKVGLPTIEDILKELTKPGRDPREHAEDIEFKKDVFSIEDLRVGMVLNGLINNITNFGAFVDIGIKDYGLIHISELSHKFIKSPHEIVKINQKVSVKVIGIDKDRKRISLSLKDV